MLAYHFVFCPKYRKPIFEAEQIRKELRLLIEGECAYRHWDILAFEIMPDHLHLLVKAKPSIAAETIAQTLKGISSRELRKHFPYLKDAIRNHLWASSYFVDSVGVMDMKSIRRYIERQEIEWRRKKRLMR